MLVARVIAQPGGDWRDDPWRAVLLAFGAAPYALALAASYRAARRPRVRVLLLGASALLSWPVAMLTYSVMLPPALLLVAATVLASLAAAHSHEPLGLRPPLLTGVVVLGWALGFVATFAGPDEPRCWHVVEYEDGRYTRTEIQPPPGMSEGSASATLRPPGPGVRSEGQTCTSDVVTAREGLSALALLGLAGTAAALALRPRARRDSGVATLAGAA